MDGEEGTEQATAPVVDETASTDAPSGTDVEREPATTEEVGADTDQPTPEKLQEQINALTEQAGQAERRHTEQLGTARRQSDEAMGRARTKWDREQESKSVKDRATTLGSRVKAGEADVVEELVSLVHETIDRPTREAAEFEGTSEAMMRGAASAYAPRVARLEPSNEEEQRYIALAQAGRWPELDQALLEAEKAKWGTPASATSETKRREQEEVAARRRGQGADLTRARGGTRAGFKTKMEARTLHVQNKLTNAEMIQINADPNIPEK